jgi:hypothetical protein
MKNRNEDTKRLCKCNTTNRVFFERVNNYFV